MTSAPYTSRRKGSAPAYAPPTLRAAAAWSKGLKGKGVATTQYPCVDGSHHTEGCMVGVYVLAFGAGAGGRVGLNPR